MNVKEFTLLTEDGVTLSVSHSSYGHPNVCIVAHGFLGDRRRTYIARLSERLSQHFDIVTFDFRGHGASGGTASNIGTVYDIKAIIQYTDRHGYKNTALVGFSWGGIASIHAIARFHNVDALVAVGTPADFERITPKAKWLFWLTSNWLGRLILRKRVRLDRTPELPKPATAIRQVSPIPILIVHGRADTLVNAKEAETLYKNAQQPKQLAIIEGMGHPPNLPDEFYDRVEDWLRKALHLFSYSIASAPVEGAEDE